MPYAIRNDNDQEIKIYYEVHGQGNVYWRSEVTAPLIREFVRKCAIKK